MRFSAPVLPGDRIELSAWDEGEGTLRFAAATPAGTVASAADRCFP